MRKLEKLPWRFYWQGVEIETKKYPKNIITLEVYTLGFREGLIGV
jgi:MSHA biogenesis protein MshJ